MMAFHLIAELNPEQPRPLRIQAARGMQSLSILQGRSLDDGRRAIELLRGKTTVVFQLGDTELPLRQRLTDLISGGLCAIGGQLTCISDDVLLLRP